MSRVGIVLVTPALLESLKAQGVADKELSALLATDRLIPIAHGTTFDALREVSPLLAARSGLTIGDDLSMKDAADKIAAAAAAEDTRSEEHTSELQSLMRISYAVFCLKKKIKQTQNEQ